MGRLGRGYVEQAKILRRLDYGVISGFGDPLCGQSAYSVWPALDVVGQARGGIMGITGPTADQPLKIGPGVGDKVPALMLAFGLLAAVRHAAGSGEGQLLAISHIDGEMALFDGSENGRAECREGVCEAAAYSAVCVYIENQEVEHLWRD